MHFLTYMYINYPMSANVHDIRQARLFIQFYYLRILAHELTTIVIYKVTLNRYTNRGIYE